MYSERALWTGFMESAERLPECSAVFVESRTLSYRELKDRATCIAATIQAYPELSQESLTAVFAYRSPTAFAGVLGTLLAGCGYVPLNRMFPIERTIAMLQRSGCRSVVVDEGSMAQLSPLLDRAEESILVILPDALDVDGYKKERP